MLLSRLRPTATLLGYFADVGSTFGTFLVSSPTSVLPPPPDINPPLGDPTPALRGLISGPVNFLQCTGPQLALLGRPGLM